MAPPTIELWVDDHQEYEPGVVHAHLRHAQLAIDPRPGHECQKTAVDPHLVTSTDEQGAPGHLPPVPGREIRPMETLTEAMRRPRTEGYVHDVRAFKGGQLRCGTCGFLLAIVCPGGCLAQFSAAFGPAASLDTEVLQGLAHIPNK